MQIDIKVYKKIIIIKFIKSQQNARRDKKL